MNSAAAKTTLLFAHATGFCPQVWDPVIRRLQVAPLLQQTNPTSQFIALTAPYHGSRRDNSIEAVVNLENPASPRVKHPFNQWVDIVADDMYDQVRQLGNNPVTAMRSPLIGIGHSLGAVALWKTEVAHPGTFDGLILFEPPYTFTTPAHSKSMDFLVSVTLQRESKWPTQDAAVAYFESYRNFASWDRESLRSYVDGAIVQDAEDNTWSLACHPHIEASVYSGPWLSLRCEEWAKPKCRVVFQNGARSKLFERAFFKGLEAKHPDVYKSSKSHCEHVTSYGSGRPCSSFDKDFKGVVGIPAIS
ncbi:Serine protease family s33, partial [Globisporangium splendens]